MKILSMFAAVAALVFAMGFDASAQSFRNTATGGYCPPNTCAKNGGPTAANTKNCKKRHCVGAQSSTPVSERKRNNR